MLKQTSNSQLVMEPKRVSGAERFGIHYCRELNFTVVGVVVVVAVVAVVVVVVVVVAVVVVAVVCCGCCFGRKGNAITAAPYP